MEPISQGTKSEGYKLVSILSTLLAVIVFAGHAAGNSNTDYFGLQFVVIRKAPVCQNDHILFAMIKAGWPRKITWSFNNNFTGELVLEYWCAEGCVRLVVPVNYRLRLRIAGLYRFGPF